MTLQARHEKSKKTVSSWQNDREVWVRWNRKSKFLNDMVSDKVCKGKRERGINYLEEKLKYKLVHWSNVLILGYQPVK